MASNSALALQKAIEVALEGMTAPNETTGIGSVIVGLHDHPPEDAPTPFVALERHEVAADDTQDGPADSHTVELIVWSTYRGTRQVQEIVGQIVERLHDATLELEVGQCMSCRVTRCVTEREPDGSTYKGTVTLTALTSTEDL